MNETGFRRFQQGRTGYVLRTRPSQKVRDAQKCTHGDEVGFTLVELLIVVTILPMIIGALSVGLIAVFSLNSGVSNRIANTSDSQVVAANYQNDVQGALNITTENPSPGQCGAGTGTQLFGVESNVQQVGNTVTYETHISYVTEQVGSGSSVTYSLVRLLCSGGSTTPINTSTLAYNLPSAQLPPTITCAVGSSDLCSAALLSQGWVSTKNVTEVTFAVTEPGPTVTSPSSQSYSYTLIASPNASTSTSSQGSPVNQNSSANCYFADANSGTYANQLCFVDFSGLTGNALLTAESTCLEISVALRNGSTLYFCLSVSTYDPANKIEGVHSNPLPTYNNAFLGNSNNGTPFYTGIDGNPALYSQHALNYLATIKFTGITVVGPNGLPATGWEIVSADAESTDNQESIIWTSDANLHVLPNSPGDDYGSNTYGCTSSGPTAYGTGVSGIDTGTLEVRGCTASSPYSGVLKNGTMMVWAAHPSWLTVNMVHYEAVTFGMLLP